MSVTRAQLRAAQKARVDLEIMPGILTHCMERLDLVLVDSPEHTEAWDHLLTAIGAIQHAHRALDQIPLNPEADQKMREWEIADQTTA
jgi:hypothetical protein